MERLVRLLIALCVMTILTSCSAEFQIGTGNLSSNDNLNFTGELSLEQSDELLQNTDWLPIGTVVKLKDVDYKIMIIGLLQTVNGDQSTVLDYGGVLYPQGMMSVDNSYAFNKDQIERIYYCGYINEEQKEFEKMVNSAIEDFENS